MIKLPESLTPKSKTRKNESLLKTFEQNCPSASDYGSFDVCSLTCCRLRAQTSATVQKVNERIQSESSTLGTDGQDLLHGVESHRRRLIGEAMTDSLVGR